LAQLLFNTAFTLVTGSILIAIITGIICDTFGELRVEQARRATAAAMAC
jgi:hypothetical protein